MSEQIEPKLPTKTSAIVAAIAVAALGYFVDIYDLLLFSIVRIKSLKDLGVLDEKLILEQGIYLLNMQMIGLLIGGIFWGVLGDKKGRVSVLFGSIFLYSIANFINGSVQNVEQYAILRLIAGIGLAGELGAGITLVSEIMPKETRGYGTTIVASMGILGAVVAALVGNIFDWRVSYFIGGGLGLILLFLRLSVYESKLFSELLNQKDKNISKGNFFLLFKSKDRILKYLSCIFVGLPIWYVVGILITLAPEFGKSFGMEIIPTAGEAVKYCYIGLVFGDLGSGFLSQKIKNRRKVILLFLGFTFLAIAAFFTIAKASISAFYLVCLILGLAIGYWALFVTCAAENFGTNIRATVTTTVPNFVRGAVVPLTITFNATKDNLGIQVSAMAIGIFTLIIAVISLAYLQETFNKDLNYLELDC